MKKLITLLAFGLFFCLVGKAQQIENISNSESISFDTPISVFSITTGTPVDKRIDSGQIWLSLDLAKSGEAYAEDGSFDAQESMEVEFELQAMKDGMIVPDVFGIQQFTLQVSKDSPKAYFVKEISPYVESSGSDEQFTFNQIQVKITSNNIAGLGADLKSKIYFQFNSRVSYGFDLQGIDAPVAVSTGLMEGDPGKRVHFNWIMNSNVDLSYFQLQLLRLYNTDSSKTISEKEITAKIDWSKAVNLTVSPDEHEAGSNAYTYTYSLGEGTGYYVWRVRAVSDYHIEALSNSLNFGSWMSNAPNDGAVIELNSGTSLDNCFIYFNDPESSSNYNFSRFFAENGKIKEAVTYANHLNQVKQAMTYLPSKDVTLITHTVNDHLGRPALVTMPVPVDEKRLSFYDGFLKGESGELYTASNYDEDTNLLNPDKVSNSTPVSYYDGTKESVPDAEGYPYSRTIYYNDGTGRTKEVSGVGMTHRIKSDGIKHTTRYLYETASEEELVALFGGEAPNSEDVFKTITVDPNNVATVTFTNKEGQVIISGLSFSDISTSGLDPLETENSSIEVTNVVTRSSRTTDGFVSSKRINLLSVGAIFLDYRIESQALEQLCLTTNLDCNYKVNITVSKLKDDNTLSTVAAYSSLELSDCSDSSESTANGSKCINTVVIDNLSPGTYIVQKELVPQGLTQSVSGNSEEISNQIAPITNLIAEWLGAVQTVDELQNVFLQLENLAASIENESLSSDFPGDFSVVWLDSVYAPNASEYAMEVGKSVTGNITSVFLYTPCCQEMEIPINWEPPVDIDLDENGNGLIDLEERKDRNEDGRIDMTDMPSFEQFAIDVLSDCLVAGLDQLDRTEEELALEAKAFLYTNYMVGWTPGDFDEMVYHMTYDPYSSYPGETAKVQYNSDELFNCWRAVINELKNLLPGCKTFERSVSGNVSDTYTDEYNADTRDDKYEKGHDDTFDDIDLDLPWFLRIFVSKKKISRRIRDAQNRDISGNSTLSPELPDFHLVYEFLSCTGYTFAKVLTPMDPNPVDCDYFSDQDFQYSQSYYTPLLAPVPIRINSVSKSEYYTNPIYLRPDCSHYYVPISENGLYWGPVDNSSSKLLFPKIRNPHYAFKYFYYEEIGSDPEMEGMNCFTDPNDCYLTDMVDLTQYYVADSINTNGIVTWDFQQAPCCLNSPESDPADCKLCYDDTSYPNPDEPTKLVVREFSDLGRIRCPYNHEKWSSGQLLSFYLILQNKVSADDLGWDISTVDITMEDYVILQKWYKNDEENELAYMIPDRVYQTLGTEKAFYSLMEYERADADGAFVMVEKEMYDLEQNALEECDRKRAEIQTKIYQMLSDRCYEIGDCRTSDPNTSNIIPQEDIDKLVEAVVAHMKEQCVLNTFSIEEYSSRDLKTPLSQFGSVSTTVKLQYGVGGLADGMRDGTSYDDNITSFARSTDFNADYTRYFFDSDGDGYPDTNPEWNPSWYQYTMLNQIKEWDFDLALPDKCQDITNDTPDCNDNLDHFIDRSLYEVNPNVIVDEQSTELNVPVKSPSKVLEVQSSSN